MLLRAAMGTGAAVPPHSSLSLLPKHCEPGYSQGTALVLELSVLGQMGQSFMCRWFPKEIVPLQYGDGESR